MRIQKKSSVCLVFFPNRSVTYISPDNSNPIQRPTQTPTHHHYSLGHLAKTTQKKTAPAQLPYCLSRTLFRNCTNNYKYHPSGSYNRPFGITVLTSRYDLILLFALNILHDDNTYNQATNIKHHHIEQFGSASPISYVLSSYYTRTEAIKRNAAILKVSPPLLPDRPS